MRFKGVLRDVMWLNGRKGFHRGFILGSGASGWMGSMGLNVLSGRSQRGFWWVLGSLRKFQKHISVFLGLKMFLAGSQCRFRRSPGVIRVFQGFTWDYHMLLAYSSSYFTVHHSNKWRAKCKKTGISLWTSSGTPSEIPTKISSRMSLGNP